MEKKYIILRILICILIVMIITIFILCYIFSKQKSPESGKEYDEEEYTTEAQELYGDYQPNVKFTQLESNNIYFTVKKMAETVVTYIKQVNGIIGMQTYTEPEVSKEGLEMLTSVLDKSYIDEYNITDKTLLKKVSDYTNYDLKIEKIYLSEASNRINYYLVYATLDNKDFNLLIKTDLDNYAFSVFLPEYVKDKNYSNEMEESEINLDKNEIEKNDYNIFMYSNISDQYLIDTYLRDYKDIMFSDIEKAYNLLDEEYRDKRFGSIEEFRKYVQSNKEELEEITIESYMKNTYQDEQEYVGKDQYDNIYVFTSHYAMDYRVELDDYTLSNEQLDEEYMNLSTQEKVVNNINKWIKMLNHRDYKSAFEVLDETFRKENFNDSVDDFADYMKLYFPEHYEFDVEKYSDETGVSAIEILMHDITGKEMADVGETIYMQLGEGTDFVMSFTLPRY